MSSIALLMSKDRTLIAVIDDEEPVRKALGRLLESVGMAVEIFSGGGEFLASLSTHRPDCAVLDLHMPEVTGWRSSKVEGLAKRLENRGLPILGGASHCPAV